MGTYGHQQGILVKRLDYPKNRMRDHSQIVTFLDEERTSVVTRSFSAHWTVSTKQSHLIYCLLLISENSQKKSAIWCLKKTKQNFNYNGQATSLIIEGSTMGTSTTDFQKGKGAG